MSTATATKVKIRPLHDKVVVERTEAKQTTPGGIVIPDISKEKSRQGKVLAVGDGKLLDDGSRSKMTVKIGDTVLLAAYTGTEVKLGDDEYVLVPEGELLGILEG